MSKKLKCRPSDLVGITDPYEAYCFDEAIVFVNDQINAELELVTHKKPKVQSQRRQQRLAQLLGVPAEKRYRDPAARSKG
jgi:hypothetical protein